MHVNDKHKLLQLHLARWNSNDQAIPAYCQLDFNAGALITVLEGMHACECTHVHTQDF